MAIIVIMNKKKILDYLRQHKSEFQEKYHVEEIGLFGSYARDENSATSDIDIYVNMKPDLFEIVGLKQQIEEDLSKNVDVIRKHKNMKPLLLKMIMKDVAFV